MFATQRKERYVREYEPPDDIKKLKELSMVIRGDNVREFYLNGGSVSTVTSLKKNKSVGVVDSIVPDGDTFPRHDHDVHEWLIPYKGKMQVDVGGDIFTVGPKEKMRYIVFAPGSPHSITAVGDVGLIGVTVPSDAGYPGAEF